MSDSHYDCLIIGGGPGGLTAGIYAARAGMKVLLLEKAAVGGQILVTDFIENYPGFPKGLSGWELVEAMKTQAENFGVPIESREVTSVDFTGDVKKVNLSDGAALTATTVILATGASPKKLGVPGEKQFIGKGISTCATCDAPFYRNKAVAAVGGGDTAVQESLYLTKFVDKVYLIHRRDQLRATKILQDRVLANDKVEILWDSIVTKVDGLFGLDKVLVENVKTGETRELAVEGCFIWVGILPNTDFLGGAVEVDDGGFIVTDARMQTSVPGVFAVGDVRNTPLRQVATAVGDAAIAAVSAEHYVEQVKS
ncbi:thioredoxin reductase (NADPH) [Desulfatibacillum alkenivorans DSM 16219]|jgi:thioredoxin reductase (NADPH)|uniref:Thioredoxin reductase n=1 Tax=Desulfatibacillum alkenivorans DSM 16219 TaxID=1121393 RepID=A0A1M6E519_9BACT|nr:thioredoxin-disulfide reductase [Desulfatibacillum alkenivorans]SHI80505.1 thioredoxin reductase (NADPH) [Desulfatibacillum alkenivorans DSM 16219]